MENKNYSWIILVRVVVQQKLECPFFLLARPFFYKTIISAFNLVLMHSFVYEILLYVNLIVSTFIFIGYYFTLYVCVYAFT